MTDGSAQAPDNLLGDMVREIFRDHSLKAPLHAAADGGGFDEELWATITASGFETVLGGAEPGTLADATSILRHAGYYAARVPLAEAMLAHWLAARCGWEESSAVPLVALTPLEAPALGFTGAPTCVLPDVPFGRYATAVYVPSGRQIARCTAQASSVREAVNLAGEPRDTLTLQREQLQRSDATVEFDELLSHAALFRAALMAGAMERTLDLAIDHAASRSQFGKPIAAFQAVQQALAQLAGHVAAGTAAVDLAAGHFTPLTAAIAKSRTSEAAGKAAEIAHQVIAAMGYTLEHPLHLVTRRLWSWRDECGNETYWNARIGAAAIEAGSEGLWQMLTGSAVDGSGLRESM